MVSYNKNIFSDFIVDINEDGDRSIIYLKNGDFFTIFASQRINIDNNSIKVFEEGNLCVKLYDINSIIGVERL